MGPPQDSSHHASERADRTPPSPQSHSPPKLEDDSKPQLAKVARADKGKGRASSEGTSALAVGWEEQAVVVGGVGAQRAGQPQSRSGSPGAGQRDKPQSAGRIPRILDLTMSDDEDEDSGSALPPKATEQDSDSDIEFLDELPLRPPPQAPAIAALAAPPTTTNQPSSNLMIPLKRRSGDESSEKSRPKAPRLGYPESAPGPQGGQADPSLSVSHARERTDSPRPSSEPEITKARSPTLAYPTPTTIEEPHRPRLLLRHPDGKLELKAREPPHPPPDTDIYRPPGFGNLPRVNGHFNLALQNALAASPKPQSPPTDEPLTSSSQSAGDEFPRFLSTLHRKLTQFGAMQPPSPTKAITSLHRRTSSAALLVPASLRIPPSSPQRQMLSGVSQPPGLASDTRSPSEDDVRRAERLEHWREELEGDWPFHLLRIPQSDDPIPPELENFEKEARCKGYPERRKIVRGVRTSKPSGALVRGGEGVQDDLEDAQMMNEMEGEIEVRPWGVTGLAEMVIDKTGNEVWRGAPSLPTRRTASTALAARMEKLELEERGLVFGYEREVFLRS